MQNANQPTHFDLFGYRAPAFRAALEILEKDSWPSTEVSKLVGQHGLENFISFLTQHGLANIFYEGIPKHNGESKDEQDIKDALRPHALSDAARYLSQRGTLRKIHMAFEAAGIKYAVFKGAHVRESTYAEAWLRPTQDIDVLVEGKDKAAAIEALREAGMAYHPNPEVLSHEVTLSNADTSVDLHWHIMRPGRTRVDMTEYLLSDPVLADGYRGMNPTATMFVLLTHPAINKYVCSPDAALIKLIDLCLWMRRPDIDQDELPSLINRAGLRTAAWSTLLLVKLMTNDQRYQALYEQLQPGYLQGSYIKYWVSRDLPTRYYDHRYLMRTAFSLSLHDKLTDIIRAVGLLAGYRIESRLQAPDLER